MSAILVPTPGPGAPTPPAGPSRRRRRAKEAALGYLLVLPAMAAFGVFVFYPFVNNFRLALYQSPPVPGLPSHYVGLHQAGQVLFSSAYGFPESLLTTIAFVVMVVPLSLLAGLALAVAAHRRLRGVGVYRMIFSSTVVSSVAVAALVFGTLMNPVVGFLPWLGISPHPPLLESPTWALPSIAVMTIWQFLGLSFIIMSAGLQSLPDEVLEAARIDGASSWTRFWRVIVPMLSPTIFFAVVVGTIYAFQTFGQIDILIGYDNNPARLHVNVLVYNIVNTLTQENNTGVAAVMSIALFLVTLVLTLLQMRFLERRVHYAR
ncbi:MAG: carbohydrate ABC transporter permease [Acidimicrobiales bacterium]